MNGDVSIRVHHNHGHPWTGEKGWDGMHIGAANQDDLTKYTTEAEMEGWVIYIRDYAGQNAWLYRKSL